MMIVAALIGLLLPSVTGYLLTRGLEGREPVLSLPERLGLTLLLGPTGTMWVTALLHLWTGIPVSLTLFFGVQIVALALAAGLVWKRGVALWVTRERQAAAPLWLSGLLWLLLGLSIVKVIVAASVLTFSVPTFFDDARDNWNYRGKLIAITQQIPTAIPGEEEAGGGVASYPATLPLMKAWLADLNGNWSDALANGVQLTWLLSVTLLVSGAVARRRGRTWGQVAAIALLGLPLLVMHGLHAYADLFLAAHALAVILTLFEASQAKDRTALRSWLLLGIALIALLPATKNEGLAVFLPSALLLLGWTLWRQVRLGLLETRDLTHTLSLLGVLGLLGTVPWLVFKLQHGLVFGNAHSVTSSSFGWQDGVLMSIGYHFFSEANWLLLPGIILGLLIIRWRTALSFEMRPLTISCLWLLAGLSAIFLFNSDLGHEALQQTGYGRAMVQIAPSWLLLTLLLLPDPHHEA